MPWYDAGALLIGMILALMALSVPVAIAFLATNIVCALIFIGGIGALEQVVDASTALITRFTLAPVPMFVLMGAFFFHTGLAIRVFDALDKLIGRLPGRLCYLTVAGGAMFSTLTGSTLANTAMLGSLLVPEMQRRGYSKRMSMGPILGTGGLAMIIPPSGLGVLLASIASLDVGQLLIAGLLPGIMLAGLYATMIFLQVRLDPEAAPSYAVERVSLKEKLVSVATNILPMGLVVFMVVGFIIFGITTPTEAAAFGVLGVLLLSLAFRAFSWDAVRLSVAATIRVTGVVFFIMMNSAVFSQLLAYSGASGGMLRWATGFQIEPLVVVVIMFAVLLVLGMFMDSVSMMLITVPIYMPLIDSLGYDPIWFAVIMLMGVEMGMTTPPFGMLLFVMMGVAPKGTTLGQVAKAALPFLLCDTILVATLIAFPILALYLPGMMR